MKVLYHHRTMADGAEGIHIREIVSALRGLGHEVLVVALAGDPTQPAATRRASPVGILRRVIPAFAYELAELGYNVVGYRNLVTAIRRFTPDVIYDRYNTYGTAALNAARRVGLPLLLEVNAPMAYERSEYEHLRLKLPRLAQRYERRIFQGADRIFAVSTPLKQHLVGVTGVTPEKIVVLPNGADPDVFVPASGDAIRRRFGLQDRVVIGFVGILRPWHGVDLLLEAFKAVQAGHRRTHLLIVGDGPIQAQLESRAGELGLADDVMFTGRLPHAAVVEHIAAMDVCVSPHATFYASPMKILEYMAMQKAVVAPDTENIRDLIEDGRTGLLFAPESKESLANTLSRAMADDDLRARLGMSARQRIVGQLNWRQAAGRIVREAAELCAPAGRRDSAV